MARTYGEIAGNPPGTEYASREALSKAKVHRPPQGGICGGKDGAESIVVSGGYVDDEDYGDEIVYTGQGGNDAITKRQIADQTLTAGNLGLAVSCDNGYPVRVCRGANGEPAHSPATGFRYDGLFRVVAYWSEKGKDGYRIWRFRLEQIDADEAPDIFEPQTKQPPAKGASRTKTTVIQRIVRNTAITQWVKTLHKFACQVCGEILLTPAGPYAEGAHIRALGRPHNGPDEVANVLCLCPNHHVLFDAGALTIDDDGTVRDSSGAAAANLRLHPKHLLDPQHLTYHRETHAGI